MLRDWLEDSINKNKKLPAKEYLSGKSERAKRGMQLEKAKAAKGAEEEKNFVNTCTYQHSMAQTRPKN